MLTDITTDDMLDEFEASETVELTFISTRHGEASDPNHTHELTVRATAGDRCREHTFSEISRDAANSLLGDLMGVAMLDAALFSPQLVDTGMVIDSASLSGEGADPCATDGEFGDSDF
jgi:hypothetical protein